MTDSQILRAAFKQAESEYYEALRDVEAATERFTIAKQKKRAMLRAVERHDLPRDGQPEQGEAMCASPRKPFVEVPGL